MEKCKDCGKEFSGRRGLSGHMWIVHRKRTGFIAEYDADKSQFLASLDQLGKRLEAIDKRLATASTDGHKLPKQELEQIETRIKQELKQIEARTKQAEADIKGLLIHFKLHRE